MDRLGVVALVLATGLIVAGFLVGDGFARGRRTDRFVEVKGLAEQEVTADLALWPLRYAVSADDLSAAQAQMTRSTQQIVRVVSTVQYFLE